VKSGAVAALTVRATVVVMGSAAATGLTVTFEVPVVAVLLDEKVRVELPLPARRWRRIEAGGNACRQP